MQVTYIWKFTSIGLLQAVTIELVILCLIMQIDTNYAAGSSMRKFRQYIFSINLLMIIAGADDSEKLQQSCKNLIVGHKA